MKKLIALAAMLVPSFASAQTVITDANSLTQKLIDIGNTVMYVLISFAVIWIIFNVVRFLIMGADNEEKRKNASHSILWGIVGLFVILSIWGLVNILTSTFRTTPTTQPLPTISNNNVPVIR